MKIEAFDGGLKIGEKPNGEADATRGLENVDAAADAFNGFGDVMGAAFGKGAPIVVADNIAGGGREFVVRDRFAGDAKVVGNADGGGEAGFQVNITGATVACRTDQRIENHRLVLKQ